MEEGQKPPEDKYAKEGVYDRIPLNKKHLNIIIIVLIAAIILFFVLGVLAGKGVI